MNNKTNQDFNVYLTNTPLCDSNHPDIQRITSQIINTKMSNVEKAKSVFYYVRDNIKYALGGSGLITPASRVFKIGYGDCGTKTNAHIALLRAAKIPARMHGAMADASVLKDFMPNWLYKAATSKGCKDYHFWTECYIEDRWIACDGLLDQKLYERCIEKDIFSKEIIPTNNWNGADSYTPLEPWILEDFGYKPSWDEWSEIYLKSMLPWASKLMLKIFELIISPIGRKATDKIRKQY